MQLPPRPSLKQSPFRPLGSEKRLTTSSMAAAVTGPASEAPVAEAEAVVSVAAKVVTSAAAEVATVEAEVEGTTAGEASAVGRRAAAGADRAALVVEELLPRVLAAA